MLEKCLKQKKIKLEKKFIIKIFCYLREAERSVDFSLVTDWNEFVTYYKEKESAIKEIIKELENKLPHTLHLERPFYLKKLKKKYLKYSWIKEHFNRFKKNLYLEIDTVYFTKLLFEELLLVLELKGYPAKGIIKSNEKYTIVLPYVDADMPLPETKEYEGYAIIGERLEGISRLKITDRKKIYELRMDFTYLQDKYIVSFFQFKKIFKKARLVKHYMQAEHLEAEAFSIEEILGDL